MSRPSTFTVYNASAGSGKTFTLVKEYLKILLSSEDLFKFQQVLAITFTNKAAHEMKERVLKNLESFSREDSNELLEVIQKEAQIDSEVLKIRSAKILEAILQNYTAFSITTIDSFTHRIIKSFAYDLGLSQSFEVEMDADELLKESIDVLISRIGSDTEITNVLIEYAKDKSDNDQSWDISKDLFEFSKMLLNEDHVRHLQKIGEKSISDFEALNSQLKLQNKEIGKEIQELGTKGLERISSLGLEFSDFTSSFFPKLLKKMIDFKNSNNLSFTASLNKMFDHEKPMYPQRISSERKSIIDMNFSFFQETYNKSKSIYSNYRFNKLMLKSIIPLATLQYIHKELQEIKEENNIQLNSEFNHLISQNIQNQPAPFIYERIGNKYRHYFIDEMQDTSQMQWQNLIPLLHNTLSQEESSLMLVGDGKQSIYRWRGGRAEQFIDLGNNVSGENPFSIQKKVETLKINYRSYSEVVDFNNQFFDFASQYLSNDQYKKLFKETSRQEILESKKGGFVSIDFVDDDKDDEENSYRYAKKTKRIIEEVSSDFDLSEICVIVRKRKEGVLIADYLTKNGIPIISSETLLLQNSVKVNFLIHLLEYSNQKTDDIKFQLIHFLFDHFKIEESQHSFFGKSFNADSIFEFLPIDFDEAYFAELPLYERMEYAIETFKLLSESDAYVQFFLDEVLRWQQKEMGIQEVMDYWELKKEKLSIVSPEASNAIQIMTIHKSKGLEFPVVIYAGDVNVYEQVNPKVWLNHRYKNFDDFLIPFTKELSELDDVTQGIYSLRREELELDALNLLYVALTRAKEQLYVVTDNSKPTEIEPTYYSQYFKHYLSNKKKFEENRIDYKLGSGARVSRRVNDQNSQHSYQERFNAVSRQDHQIEVLASSSKLWGTQQEVAISYGNLIHEILSKIDSRNDVESVLQSEFEAGNIEESLYFELRNKLELIANHPKLGSYYGDNVKAFNERALTDIDGQILIPDRLVFLENETIIIDYKTGSESESHIQQLLKYERLLKTMGYYQVKKVLVYISDNIRVTEF